MDSLSLGVRVETALGDQVAAEAYRERLRNEFPHEVDKLRMEGETR